MKWLQRQRVRYVLKHHPIAFAIWESLAHRGQIFSGLSAVELAHLRELTTLFVHRKSMVGTHGLAVTSEMAVSVAAQACLPILKLGLDYYDGWVEVLIYPTAFRVTRDQRDETGLVSRQSRVLSGESWLRGPVILSWDEIASELSAPRAGHNVVIHEFAHKLDMLNGRANGMPPLHSDMQRTEWTAVFSQAFEHLKQRIVHHHNTVINPYAATDPGEFFAVASESFFTDPHNLHREYPLVYKQLTQFYRQQPLQRIATQG